jgi:hypothetical protein
VFLYLYTPCVVLPGVHHRDAVPPGQEPHWLHHRPVGIQPVLPCGTRWGLCCCSTVLLLGCCAAGLQLQHHAAAGQVTPCFKPASRLKHSAWLLTAVRWPRMLSCLLLRCAAGGVEGLRSREYANFTAQVSYCMLCVLSWAPTQLEQAPSIEQQLSRLLTHGSACGPCASTSVRGCCNAGCCFQRMHP